MNSSECLLFDAISTAHAIPGGLIAHCSHDSSYRFGQGDGAL